MAKKALITADDFGFTKGVTDGILFCHDNGLISNTSLMVNMPDADRAVELARKRPDLSVGLHLNLTQGLPLTDPGLIPSLVGKDGRFRKLSLAHPRKADPRHIRLEVCAQIEKFRSYGFPKLHVDGHHYVSFIPSVLNALLDVSGKYGISSMRMIDAGMIRRGVKKKIIGFSLLCLGPKAVFGLSHHVKRWRKQILAKGIAIPEALVSWELYGDADPVSSLLKTFSRLPEGTTEIFGHPGYVDGELRDISSYTDIRDKELKAFTNPDVIKTFRLCGTELVNAYWMGGQ